MAVTKSLITSYTYNGDTKPIYLIENHEAHSLVNTGSFGVKATYSNVASQSEFFSIISDYVGDISALAVPYPDSSDYSGVATLLQAFFHNAYPVPAATPATEPNTIFAHENLYTSSQANNSTTACNATIYSTSKTPVGASVLFSSETNLRFYLGFYVFDTDELRDDEIHVNSGSKKMFVIDYSGITFELNIRSSNLFDITSTNSTIFNNKTIPPYIPVVPGEDPYDPSGDGSGYSGTGGGPAPTGGTGATGTGGLHDDTSDAIPTPNTPSDIAIGGGLFTAYNPDAGQLADFASALWSMQPTDINDVLRFLFGGDAFNAVIGLHLLPVAPSTSGSPINIKLGNWVTNASAPKITSQYKQVPFGSVLLPEYWGNCIDYAPYTKIQLALPYIGIVDVDTDDVLGSTNTLTYNIDVLSGAICATLHCVKGNLNSVIYQWSGACAVSLPFSGASYNSVLGAIAGIAAAGMGFASMAAGPIGAALPAAALAVGGGAFGAGSAASIMGTMKGKVQKSGSFGANSGALGIMTPYFILTRPVQSVPTSWQADKGYPANISAQLGTLLGYTEVSEINLECSGTEAEKKEIIDLLKKGVLF